MSTKISELVNQAVEKSVWQTPSVSDQPSITLVRWSVMETQFGERHFVGYNLDDREGRVSTSIQAFDTVLAQGITKSGRIYHLLGPPGYDSDGAWVWSHWVQARKIKWHEVTDEFKNLLSAQSHHEPSQEGPLKGTRDLKELLKSYDLTGAQRRLLNALTLDPTPHIYAKMYMEIHKLTRGGIRSALRRLTAVKLVEKEDGVWQVQPHEMRLWYSTVLKRGQTAAEDLRFA